FDEPRGIELLGQFPHVLHPVLRTREIRRTRGGSGDSFFVPGRKIAVQADDVREETGLSAEAPGFVEEAPRENGRVIEVAVDGFAQHCFETLPAKPRVTAFA